MKAKIVFIDDEENILNALKRVMRKEDYECFYTTDPDEALALIKNEKISVIVSDQRMPKMEGVEVLMNARKLSPDTVRIMLTGYADISAVVNAINKGSIYRFVTKPWEDEDIRQILKEAIRHFSLIDENHRLLQLTEKQNKELIAFNEELEKKVRDRTAEITELNKQLQLGFLGSIQLMAKILQIYNTAMGLHAKRVTKLAIPLGKQFGLAGRNLFEFQVACLLHNLGRISIPSELLSKDPEKLLPEEKLKIQNHVLHGEMLLKEIPNLTLAPKIVRNHLEWFNGSGGPDKLAGVEIPLESRIISVVSIYDEICYSGDSFSNENSEKAVNFLNEGSGLQFDPEIVEALKALVNKTAQDEIEIGLIELLPGMIISRTVQNSEGKKILEKGTVLKKSMIDHLREWLKNDPVFTSIYIKRAEPPKEGKKNAPVKPKKNWA